MAHYVRILSTSAEPVTLEYLRASLRKQHASAVLTLEAGTADQWEQIILTHGDGTEIAAIERNAFGASTLAFEELKEFSEEIAGEKPARAVEWLKNYFPRVQCIYACQLLSGTDHLNGWDIFGGVKEVIWNFAPAIFQADREGFSNEDGYHILWQFSDRVKGKWWMGIFENGQWIHFQMDLANQEHRHAFLDGRVPAGVQFAG